MSEKCLRICNRMLNRCSMVMGRNLFGLSRKIGTLDKTKLSCESLLNTCFEKDLRFIHRFWNKSSRINVFIWIDWWVLVEQYFDLRRTDRLRQERQRCLYAADRPSAPLLSDESRRCLPTLHHAYEWNRRHSSSCNVPNLSSSCFIFAAKKLKLNRF